MSHTIGKQYSLTERNNVIQGDPLSVYIRYF